MLAIPYAPVRQMFEAAARGSCGASSRMLAGRLRAMDEALADSVFLDVTGRTAKRLLELAGDADEFVLPVTQEELAGHGRCLAGAGEQGHRQLHPPRLARAARPPLPIADSGTGSSCRAR